ncbi:hypothetical protein [Egicoccus sp. AB-alg6-2]|uniref:hypothetical protein n=1 Tax=Egicoccus sp. AB-alg6-2 TaxID=3242692 RepID=UPI00359DC5C0
MANLWFLDGDEHAIAISEQAEAGDFVVRRVGALLEVGEIADGDEPQVAWFGEVEQALLPAMDAVETAEERRGPLQRIPDDGDLRAAIEGIESAERTRGG